MKKALMVSFCLSAGLMMTAPCSYAEEPKTVLEEVVVTATRTEKDVESAPGSVTVITHEEMEKRDVRTVDEALNTVAGVFNRRANPMDTLAAVSLRGIPDQKRTLVLLDGMPLNDSYTGGVSFGGLTPDIIDRIEVVQGPFSSLYGGNAMGGVVNLITKLPEKREFTFRSGFGSSFERGDSLDDRREIFLSYGDRLFDKLSLSASYGYGSINGYSKTMVLQSSAPVGTTGGETTTDNQGNPKYTVGDKGDNRWWDDSLTIRAEYDFSKQTSLRASWLRTRSEYNYDDPHTLLRDGTGNPVYASGSLKESAFLSGAGGQVQDNYQLSFTTELSPVKVGINLGFVDQGENWYTTPGSTATRTAFCGCSLVRKNWVSRRA
ncbi:MAG: TonB-dependent receptor plug domain-containing protein [Nitrospirales bacterium]|nr:TonB-dependent receptor plug domain-containing protein [Nitrospirales bacterium]